MTLEELNKKIKKLIYELKNNVNTNDEAISQSEESLLAVKDLKVQLYISLVRTKKMKQLKSDLHSITQKNNALSQELGLEP